MPEVYVLVRDGNQTPIDRLPQAKLTVQEWRQANNRLDAQGIQGDWVPVSMAISESKIDRWVQVRKVVKE